MTKSVVSSFIFIYFFLFLLFCTLISNWFHVLVRSFYTKSKTTFSKQFFLNSFFCVFLFAKLKNVQKDAQIVCEIAWCHYLPPFRSNFQKIFFSKTYSSFIQNINNCSEGDIWKISRRRITELKNQGPRAQYFPRSGLLLVYRESMVWYLPSLCQLPANKKFPSAV